MAIRVGNGGEMAFVLRVKDDGTAVIEKFADTSEKSADRSSEAWSKAGKALGAIAVSAVATAAAMVKTALDTVDASGDMADTIGVTIEQFSRLTHAADMLGDVTRDELGTSLRFMVKNLSDAAAGTGEAKDALRDLNLNAAELARLAPDQALLKIVEAMEGFERQGDRLALSQEIFGRGNQRMALAVSQGGAAFRDAMADADKYGVVISGDLKRKQEELERQLKQAKAAVQGLSFALAEEATPALTATAEAMQRFFAQGETGREFVGALSTVVKGAAHVVIGLAAGFESLGKGIGAAAAAAMETAKLNFSEAREILRLYAEDRKRIEKDMLESQAKLWDAPASASPGAPPPSKGGGSTLNRSSAEQIKQREELEKRLQEIGAWSLNEQAQLARKYVEDYTALNQARAAGVIATDVELNEYRATLAEQYEQKAAEQENLAIARRLADQAAAIYAMQESFLTESDIEQRRYEEKLLALENYKMSELYVEDTYRTLQAQLKEQHEENLARTEGDGLAKRYGQAGQYANSMMMLWRQGAAGQLQVTQSLFGELAGLMQSRNKTMFDIGKKAALAQAAISMYSAINSALNTVPFVPLGLAMGAVAAVKGAANIASINATQFGGAGGAVGTFSASPSTGMPTSSFDSFGPSQVPSPVQNTQARVERITLVADGPLSDAWVRDKLIPKINEARRDGVFIEIEMAA